MSAKTYKTRGLVLRKTKLGEKDLIVTLLDESGALLRAVAKGARKPGGSYAARVELFSCVDLMLAQGRNLDVITSATFADSGAKSAMGVEQAACASALAELIGSLAQEGLPHEMLFPMSRAAFARISSSGPNTALALSCAAMLKAFAYCGFRPNFTSCVSCGRTLDDGALIGQVPFSVIDGGLICTNCQRPADAFMVETNTLKWADALMRARFEDVASFDAPVDVCFAVLHLIRQWCRTHAGKNLKAIDFLLACGLF